MSFDPSRYSVMPAYITTSGGPVSVARRTAGAINTNGPFVSEQPLALFSISKKRKASGTKTCGLLPWPVSPPQLPGNATIPETDDHEKTRKKNKLGYTRISMACGRWKFLRSVRCNRLTPRHAHETRRFADDYLAQLIADEGKYVASSQKEIRSKDVRIVFI